MKASVRFWIPNQGDNSVLRAQCMNSPVFWTSSNLGRLPNSILNLSVHGASSLWRVLNSLNWDTKSCTMASLASTLPVCFFLDLKGSPVEYMFGAAGPDTGEIVPIWVSSLSSSSASPINIPCWIQNFDFTMQIAPKHQTSMFDVNFQ